MKRVLYILAMLGIVAGCILFGMCGCWQGGHRKTEASVGLDFLGFNLVTVGSLRDESVSNEAVASGARLSASARPSLVFGSGGSGEEGRPGFL